MGPIGCLGRDLKGGHALELSHVSYNCCSSPFAPIMAAGRWISIFWTELVFLSSKHTLKALPPLKFLDLMIVEEGSTGIAPVLTVLSVGVAVGTIQFDVQTQSLSSSHNNEREPFWNSRREV